MKKIINKKIFKYLIILFFLVILYASGILKPVEGILTRIFNPLFSTVQNFSTAISRKYDEQTSKIDIVSEKRELEVKVNELLSENAELKIVREENEALRNFLGFFKENDYDKVVAEVISRGDFFDAAGRIEVITIDRGANNGLYRGLVVINEKGIVVGKVMDVKDSISQVALVTNNNCKLAATIIGDDKTSGIVEGVLGLTMEMKFIPQSKSIKNDDIVITSGLEQSIPRGLVVGQVSKVVKESNELWQEAVLESSINLNELIIVSVLLPGIENDK